MMSRSSNQFSACLLLASFAFIASGCSSFSVPAYARVSGKVVDAAGKMIPGLDIRFFPLKNKDRFLEGKHMFHTPIATGNKDGAYAIRIRGGEIDGMPPGKYRVVRFGFNKAQSRRIPAKYQDADLTPLEIVIPGHDVKDLVLKVEFPAIAG